MSNVELAIFNENIIVDEIVISLVSDSFSISPNLKEFLRNKYRLIENNEELRNFKAEHPLEFDTLEKIKFHN